MAGVVNLGPFYFFFSRFLHAVAGSGHPLGGLADVADGSGWFSLAHKGQGQQPGYIKAQYKPNLSQLGPWPLEDARTGRRQVWTIGVAIGSAGARSPWGSGPLRPAFGGAMGAPRGPHRTPKGRPEGP